MQASRRILAVLRWPVGGIRTYIHYVYPTLARAGYRFTFAGPADDSFEAFQAEIGDWPEAKFVTVRCERGIDTCGADLRRLLKSDRFDLVHSHGITSAVQACLANRAIRIPHAVTSHDVFRANQFAGIAGWLKRQGIAETLRRADLIVNVTDDARRNLVEYLPGLKRGPCRLVTIPHGIDVERFDPAKCQPTGWLRNELRLGPNVFLLGFLGRFMEQKGFLPLLEALGRLPGQNWHLAAFGEGDMIREYRTECQQRGLAGQTTFLPFVADVERVLPELDALAMPSLWEAAGLLAMEALALGTPIIGSDCIGLREVLKDTPAAAPRHGDTAALSAAIAHAMSNSNREACRAFTPGARRRFDSRQAAGRLLAAVDNLLDVKPRAVVAQADAPVWPPATTPDELQRVTA